MWCNRPGVSIAAGHVYNVSTQLSKAGNQQTVIETHFPGGRFFRQLFAYLQHALNLFSTELLLLP